MFWVSKFSKCPTRFNMLSHLSLFNLLATSILTHPTLRNNSICDLFLHFNGFFARLGVWLCSHHLHLTESWTVWQNQKLCKLWSCSLPEILWYVHFLNKNDKCRSEVCIGKDSQLKVWPTTCWLCCVFRSPQRDTARLALWWKGYWPWNDAHAGRF